MIRPWLRRLRDAYGGLGEPGAGAFGSPLRWRQVRAQRRAAPPAGAAIQSLSRRAQRSVTEPDDAPVFVLAAGWRSGSTLLQRLVMSGRRILVWGEPYDRSCLVQRLAASLAPLGAAYPPAGWIFAPRGGGEARPEDTWAANLYPDLPHLVEAHRAFFDRLYAAPARELGYEAWGFKEVRLDAAHAAYLKLLYPSSRLLFLVRNPYDAFASYRAFAVWYERWPDRPVVSARQYGRLWRRLASSFVDRSEALGALLVRYEAVASDPAFADRLARHLGAPVDRSVLGRRIRGGGAKTEPQPLTRGERRSLRRAVEPFASRLGYSGPTGA